MSPTRSDVFLDRAIVLAGFAALADHDPLTWAFAAFSALWVAAYVISEWRAARGE